MFFRFCFVLLFALPTCLQAQETASKPPKVRNALSPKGYSGGMQMGMLVGFYKDPFLGYSTRAGSFSFQTYHGYRFNPYLAVYGVMELDFYDDVYLVPVLASFKATLRKHRFTPYLTGEAGYALELTNDKINGLSYKTWGGICLGSEIGLQFPTPQKTAFTLSFGGRYQRARLEYLERDNLYETSYTLRRLHIRLGMTF